MSFEPKYKFKDLSFEFDDSFLANHCYGKGQYCAISDVFIESKSELDEAIRQKCLWIYSQNDQSHKDLWWDYISTYRTCLKDKLKGTKLKTIDCYEKIANRLKFSDSTLKEIEKCYNNSFDLSPKKYESDNTILKQDSNSIEYNGVYLIPAVFVNRNLVKEDLKLHIVVGAICDKLNTKPDFCQEYLMSNINWQYPTNKNYKKSIIIIAFLVFLCLDIIVLMVLFVKRRMNRNIDEEIEQRINHHVTEYMRLRDSQNDSKM